MQMNFGLKYDVVILYCSHVIWGEESYPQIPPKMENGYTPNLKNQKSEILESKINFPQK